jgi:hypothetical protein
MIARVQALTALDFDVAAVRSNTKPNIAGVVVDSKAGLWTIYSHTIERFCRLSLFITAISAAAKILQKSTSTNKFIGA